MSVLTMDSQQLTQFAQLSEEPCIATLSARPSRVLPFEVLPVMQAGFLQQVAR